MAALLEKSHFLLGTFGTNVSSGMAVTKVPERWNNSFENNLELARMLEDAGIDFMWIGHGGVTNFQGDSLECFTWAAGLASVTTKLNLVVTAHTFINPAVAAKQMATIDQISHGRVALNIVAGWHKPEYEALGLEPPATHEEKYEVAQEWMDIVKALWTKTEYFDWDGKYWKMKNVLSSPRPGKINIINAAGSGEGRDFATRHADMLFCTVQDLAKSRVEIAELKAKAAMIGRKIEAVTLCYVVCRPTEEEAQAYHDHYVRDNADWDCAERLMHNLIANSKVFPSEVQDHIRISIAAGHGSYKLLGTPRQVADKILELHDVGFRGTTLSFVDYIKEFPYFRDEVLPLLEQAGIRKG